MVVGTQQLSEAPVWLLGTWFGLKNHDLGVDLLTAEAMQAALQDFRSRIWCTYRRFSDPICDTGITSDVGWGCTIRSGQMMIAEVLSRQSLGRSWQRPADLSIEPVLLQLLGMLHDSRASPLSIHSICSAGRAFGLVPGRWLGPWVLCKAMEAVVNGQSQAVGLRVHVVCDPGGGAPTLYRGQVEALFDGGGSLPGKQPEEPGHQGHTAAAAAAAAAGPGPELDCDGPAATAAAAVGIETAGAAAVDGEDSGGGPAGGESGLQPAVPGGAAVGAADELPPGRVDQDGPERPCTGPGTAHCNGAAADGGGSTAVEGGPSTSTAVRAEHAGEGEGSCSNSNSSSTEASTSGRAWGCGQQGAGPGRSPADVHTTPVLFMIPLTLGIERTNELYHPQLQRVLSFPQSVGIVGGRPGASLYFVGSQEGSLLYLDPHESRPLAHLPADAGSYFCDTPRLMPITGIDPSVAIGFVCRSRGDALDLCSRLEEMAREHRGAPLLLVAEGNEPEAPSEAGTDSAAAGCRPSAGLGPGSVRRSGEQPCGSPSSRSGGMLHPAEGAHAAGTGVGGADSDGWEVV